MPPGPTLDGEARLQERERPGMVTLINAETPVALGAKRSADIVKGGIARVSQPDGMCGEEACCMLVHFCLLLLSRRNRIEWNRHLGSSYPQQETADSFLQGGDRPL